jgi:pyridoxal phosphate enzyme (YggS family)
MTLPTRIAENLANVRERIAAAAQKSGRTADAITLVAVTKYVDAEATAAVVAAGCHDLGESRPQSLWSKAAVLTAPQGGTGIWPEHDPTAPIDSPAPTPLRWHQVGHLQRNKIRRTLPLVYLIQSVDSRRLLDALHEEAAQIGQPVNVLLEANISGDATKTGLPPGELEPLLADAASWRHVAICGMMGMASLEGGQAAARRDFEQLRELRDRLARHAPPEVSLAELSMGMSGDYEIAIECGATMVRVGSALFEGLSS